MGFYTESDMDFTPLFNSTSFKSFYIEKSKLYEQVKKDSVKVVEFISVKNKNFNFIECKSSFPNIKQPNEKQAIMKKAMEQALKEAYPKESQKDINKTVKQYFKSDLDIDSQKIYAKLHHSIDLFLTYQLGQECAGADFPSLGNPDVFNAKFSNYDIVFYLILKGDQFSPLACEDIQIVLQKRLKPLKKLWGVDIKVIPEKKARKLKFIH